MYSKKKYPITKLNDHDRKIIDKYTGEYTNHIESGTAKADNSESEG